jgi:ADP-ribosylglycohydrolase
MSTIYDPHYPERVYAGVLGKIIGVYLGRPFEGWHHERIVRELGEVDRYVADELNVPLVVTDDDISGTFTFLRALSDHGDNPNLTAEQIGDTWLNYIIENRTILWWGGIGLSTEHTAFLRLKNGIRAPESGSIALNGRTVAEQIGAQIFIDGWGLINPGEPEIAADFARRAASVSHDGEAVFAAQIVAAMVAQAFVEQDIAQILDVAVALIPSDSIISRMISEIRSWHSAGIDWRAAFERLRDAYGYEKYPSNCHVVPNHGVVILALLFGEGDFSRSLLIANTCGWDTDCNSANVGCILGVMGGLRAIDAGYDWRGPIRDRLYLPTADGGRCVSDAVLEALEIVRMAHSMRGERFALPKGGARFSFAFPGSVQGFEGEGLAVAHEARALRLTLLGPVGSAMTQTFAREEAGKMYSMVCSPSLSPGQMVRASVMSNSRSLRLSIQIETLCGDNEPRRLESEPISVEAGESTLLEFEVPDLEGYPVTRVGLALYGQAGDEAALEWLTWDGIPKLRLAPTSAGEAWGRAWVNAVDSATFGRDRITVVQNEGTGAILYGCREWKDVTVEAELTIDLADSVGVALRVQGLRRYYALIVTRNGVAQIVKCSPRVEVLTECRFHWDFDSKVKFRFSVDRNRLTGTVDRTIVLETVDEYDPLTNGAVGVFVSQGRVSLREFRISPV